jgi:lipid-A-disaccharide synthase-like uncharacterized protein
MKEPNPWIFAIGFLGQIIFSGRMIVQWFKSEKAKESLSPVIFWQLSLLGSVVFLIYGILRKDFAIIFGQCLVYYIYIRNLHLKQQWILLPRVIRWLIISAPVTALLYLFSNSPGNIAEALANKNIPMWLKIWGILGQVVFTLRFYIQWLDSESIKESVLTRRFWFISMTGSLMIISYAVFRYDPVLFLGQIAGLVVYVRNLMIYRKIYQE